MNPKRLLAEKVVMVLLQLEVPDDLEDLSADGVLRLLTGKPPSPEELASREAAAESQGYGYLRRPHVNG